MKGGLGWRSDLERVGARSILLSRPSTHCPDQFQREDFYTRQVSAGPCANAVTMVVLSLLSLLFYALFLIWRKRADKNGSAVQLEPGQEPTTQRLDARISSVISRVCGGFFIARNLREQGVDAFRRDQLTICGAVAMHVSDGG